MVWVDLVPAFLGNAALWLLVANSAMRSCGRGLGIPQSQVVCMAHLCVPMLWYPDKFSCELSRQTSTLLPAMGQIVCNNQGFSSTGGSLVHTAGVVPVLLVQRMNTKCLCVNIGAHCPSLQGKVAVLAATT